MTFILLQNRISNPLPFRQDTKSVPQQFLDCPSHNNHGSKSATDSALFYSKSLGNKIIASKRTSTGDWPFTIFNHN